MKKESGENPERSGHCKWGGTSQVKSLVHALGRREEPKTHKSGDLPKQQLQHLPGQRYVDRIFMCFHYI